MAAAVELGAPSLFRSPRHIVQAALTQAGRWSKRDAIPQEAVGWLWRFYICLNEMNMPARGKAAAAEGPELVQRERERESPLQRARARTESRQTETPGDGFVLTTKYLPSLLPPSMTEPGKGPTHVKLMALSELQST